MKNFILSLILISLLALLAYAGWNYYQDQQSSAPTDVSDPQDGDDGETSEDINTPDDGAPNNANDGGGDGDMVEGGNDDEADGETYNFEFFPPGDLIPDTVYGGPSGPVGSTGIENPDMVVVSPDMRFPFQTGPAFANSQVFMYGGAGRDAFATSPGNIPAPWSGHPAPKSPYAQGDPRNYDYPWRDNFCETRNYDTADCPAGKGHQGQDIRGSTCDNNSHVIVAAEDGVIAYVGRVELNIIGAETGINYRYLHMRRPLDPGLGCNFENDGCRGVAVTKGQVLGIMSNFSAYSSATDSYAYNTTAHLHFEMWASEWERINRRNAGGVGAIALYADLVRAYNDLLEDNPDQHDPVQTGATCNFVDY